MEILMSPTKTNVKQYCAFIIRIFEEACINDKIKAVYLEPAKGHRIHFKPSFPLDWILLDAKDLQIILSNKTIANHPLISTLCIQSNS